MESENVKERLTSMLHKKLSDLQEREQKEVENTDLLKSIKQEKDESQETADSTTNPQANETVAITDYQEPSITLQEILDEKKRALLHHPDVIKFLTNKK